MDRLSGRSIIVTGAGSGIGAGTALRLLGEGARVTAADVDTDGLELTRKSAEADGTMGLLDVRSLDISDEAAVVALFDERDSLDGLVNAAGILVAAHTHETTLELWNKILTVNLTGTFLMCRSAIPLLLKSPHGGRLVNFASTSAFHAHPYMAAYAASKGAIASLTHTIALEYSKQNLRAVNIVPGGVTSKITTESILSVPPDADGSLFSKLVSPLGGGSFGAPDDVAGVIAMLLSDDGKFITGTEIRIDGGAHM